MGYELRIRGGRAHTAYATFAAVHDVSRAHGFVGGTVERHLERGGRWIQLWFATVAEGPDGGDPVDEDGVRFNEILLVPRPLDLDALAVAHAFAATLGWEVVDPQAGVVLRDAAPADAPPRPPPAAAGRPRARRVGTDDWPAPAEGLGALPDGRLLVAFDAGTLGGACGIDVRSGPDLVLERRLADTGAPVAVAPDGAAVLVGGPRDGEGRTTAVEVRDARTLERMGALPLRPRFAWIPGTPDFVAVGRRTSGWVGLYRIPRTLDGGGGFEPAELLGADAWHVPSPVVVTGDRAHAVIATGVALEVFSVATGRLVRRMPLRMRSCRAAATLGPYVAVAGLAMESTGDAILVVEAHGGRTVLRVTRAALGIETTPASLAFHPSGWLAVGLENGELLILGVAGALPTGAVRRVPVGDGSLRALAFGDGELLAAGATGGVLRVPLLPDEDGPPIPVVPADPARTAAFAHDASPPRLADEPWAVLADERGGAETALLRVERLPDETLRDLERQSRAATDPRVNVGLTVAVVRRAVRAGVPLDEDLLARIGAIATEADPDGPEPMVRELLAALPDDGAREAVLTAPRPDPAWARFGLLRTEPVLRALLAVVASLPRGAYTGLKAASDRRFTVRNGHTAKEFQERAVAAMAAFGPAGAPLLREALSERFPCRRWVEEALARVERTP